MMSLPSSFCFSGLSTVGSGTGFPRCNIGVITMKMIKRTNMTSTSGVTLMSEFRPFSPSFIPTASLRSLLAHQERNDLARGLVRIDLQPFDLRGEVVVDEHRDDRDADADRGGQERLRDTGGDRAE